MIKAVSFDIDGTLLDYEQALHEALEVVRREILLVSLVDSDRLTIQKMIALRNRVTEEHKHDWSLARLRVAGFERILEHVGVRDQALAGELSAAYVTHRYEMIRAYDDVLPCLDALGSSFMLGLVSNGSSYPSQCGLPDVFGFQVFSREAGAEKPASAIFKQALRLVGCAPNELLHVGDSLEQDVLGANRVGARSVWLNRKGLSGDEGICAEYEICSLSELVGVLGR